MQWVDGEVFENQDVKLDFSQWKNCTFKKCNIIVKYGEFDLVGCNFDKCRLTLDGNAVTIAKMIEMFSRRPPDFKPNLVK
jgi:hypothetical protein